MRLVRKYRYWCSVMLLLITALFSLETLAQPVHAIGGDKVGHMLAYLSVIFPVGLKHNKLKYLIAIGLVLFSGIIELVQPYVNRQCELGDLIANTTGVALGFLLSWIVCRALAWKKGRKIRPLTGIYLHLS